MKQSPKKITPNQIALILGCVLLTISAILLIKIQEMEQELDKLIQREEEITEQIEKIE